MEKVVVTHTASYLDYCGRSWTNFTVSTFASSPTPWVESSLSVCIVWYGGIGILGMGIGIGILGIWGWVGKIKALKLVKSLFQ